MGRRVRAAPRQRQDPLWLDLLSQRHQQPDHNSPDPTTPGVVTLGNVNTASTFGAENFAAWQVSKNLNLRADYTYTVAKADLGECCLHVSSLLGPAIAAATEEQGVLDREVAGDEPAVGVRDAALCRLVVGYRSSGRAARRLQSLRQAPGFTTVNLAVNYAWTDNMTVFGRIDNLFNKYYEDPAGFVRPGFGAFGGIKFTLGGAPGGASSGPGLTTPTPPSPTPRSAGAS